MPLNLEFHLLRMPGFGVVDDKTRDLILGKAAHDLSRVDEKGFALLRDLKTVIVSKNTPRQSPGPPQVPGNVVKVGHGKALTADLEGDELTVQMNVGIFRRLL